MQQYHSKFARTKQDKKLQWLFQLGTVELEIELKDRTLSLEVTPLQAYIVECFKNTSPSLWAKVKPEWANSVPVRLTTSVLAEKLQMTEPGPLALLKNNLFYWVNAGLLREETYDQVQSWTLLEEAEKGSPAKTRSRPFLFKGVA